MAYLGLVPSEQSTGETAKRGGITKAGNGYARRALVEASWTYRFPARVTRHLLKRSRDLPMNIRNIAWKAQLRQYGAETWDKERRVIVKAEHSGRGSNPRYVVTNLEGAEQELYDNLYCARGDMENRIKE